MSSNNIEICTDDLKTVRMKEITKMLGLGRTTIYRLIVAGDFPPKVQLGKRSVGYFVKDINEWQQKRIKHTN